MYLWTTTGFTYLFAVNNKNSYNITLDANNVFVNRNRLYIFICGEQ